MVIGRDPGYFFTFSFFVSFILRVTVSGETDSILTPAGPVTEIFSSEEPALRGAGFTLALLLLGSVREILGSGTLLGFPLFGDPFDAVACEPDQPRHEHQPQPGRLAHVFPR